MSTDISELLQDLTSVDVTAKYQPLQQKGEVIDVQPVPPSRTLQEPRTDEFSEKLTRNLHMDYDDSRERIRRLLEEAERVYLMAVSESLSTGDPKHVSSLSSLFKSMVDGSTKLLELSDKYRERPLLQEEPSQTNIQVNNYQTYENLISSMDNSMDNRFKEDK